jgi:hypothetical protein
MKSWTFRWAGQRRRRIAVLPWVVEVLESRALLADGITPAAVVPIRASAGVPIANAVFATFTVTDPAATPGDGWRALINFGDGQVDGPIIPVQKGEEFELIDTHTYRTPGDYTVTVMIAVPGSMKPNDNTVTTQVIVTAANGPPSTPPTVPVATGMNVTGKANRTFHKPVARFNDPSHTRPLGALISWGDQSPPTTGRIRGRGRGHFQIIGSHDYAEPGRFPVVVTIQDASGHVFVAESTAIIKAHG